MLFWFVLYLLEAKCSDHQSVLIGSLWGSFHNTIHAATGLDFYPKQGASVDEQPKLAMAYFP